jgi:hypothetical protein
VAGRTGEFLNVGGPGPARPWLGPALVALAAFALHAAAWDRYGIFRDELYFISCGERLAWGYVDQPPLIAAMARIAHDAFGLWVPGLRLLPWIASALTVWATGMLALELGAGAAGATLAALGVLASPRAGAPGSGYQPAVSSGSGFSSSTRWGSTRPRSGRGWFSPRVDAGRSPPGGRSPERWSRRRSSTRT